MYRSLFFFCEIWESVYSFASKCWSRRKSEIARRWRDRLVELLSRRRKLFLRCLDILRDLTARSSFTRRPFLSYPRLFPMWAMRIREHTSSTSYRYVRRIIFFVSHKKCKNPYETFIHGLICLNIIADPSGASRQIIFHSKYDSFRDSNFYHFFLFFCIEYYLLSEKISWNIQICIDILQILEKVK